MEESGDYINFRMSLARVEVIVYRKTFKATIPAFFYRYPMTPSLPPTVSPADYEKYKGYLLDGETIESIFDLGSRFLKLYRVIATNRRLIIIKKFPKNLLEIDYANIELIEYFTNVDWLYSLYSGLVLVITSIFFFNRNAVVSSLSNFIPPLAPILDSPLLPGLNAGSSILTAVGMGIFLYFFGLFVLSLMGRLRILIYDQPPIDIVSILSTEIQDLIKIFETKKRKNGTAPMQQAHYQSRDAANTSQPSQESVAKQK